jgi:hypothetical protein
MKVASYEDFALGIAAGLIPVVCWKIWSLFQAPKCAKIQALAAVPVPKLGDDSKITVWGFQKQGDYPGYQNGVSDGSPYVARVECYLRLIDKPYVKAASVDLSENPRGKMPMANVFGTMVDDSARILEAIQCHYDIDADKGLTAQQKANGHLVRRLMTGSLYWVRLHMNFGMEHGREAVRNGFKDSIPAALMPLIFPMVIRGQQANLDGQGIGKLTHNEIIEMGKEDLRALATLLGNNKYVLGTKEATVYDCDVYAFVSHCFYDATPAAMEWVKEIRKELPNLDKYIAHMRTLFFPEIKAKAN